MCGRYHIETNTEALYHPFQILIDASDEKEFRLYNIAPDQGTATRPPKLEPVIRRSGNGNELVMMQWWLLPRWSKERHIKYSTFNARAETVATNATFRYPLRYRRCLVPVSGFYEWQQLPDRKQPWNIGMANRQLFAFAGLWDRWEQEGQVVESYSVIVTEPNELMQAIHNRMPVIIPPGQYTRWLDPTLTDPKEVLPLLRPYPADKMSAYQVSTRVNNARFDDPALLAPITG